jgi:ectoine hydroxylase-related dioxygenase (phytanoyl-CoA dioxygenase family)
VIDAHQFDKNGFAIVHDLLGASQCATLADELSRLLEQQQQVNPKARGGLRNVLRISPLAASVASSETILSVVSGLLGGDTFPVRAILFDKTDGANWGVPWHQDLSIAVAERIDTDGFGPWSLKEGVVHVQPPLHVLAGMITVRLHLDDCHADNGALRVLPGSHLRGELNSEDIATSTARSCGVTCESPVGGAVIMRPLLLHASSPAKNPSHRRVFHIEYATAELPNGLRWSERSLRSPVRKEQL